MKPENDKATHREKESERERERERERKNNKNHVLCNHTPHMHIRVQV